MTNYLSSLGSVLAVLLLAGCTSQSIESPTVVQTQIIELTRIIESEPIKQPLQIATWSPTASMGRLTAMNFGYLKSYHNCLVLTDDKDSLPTADNSLLLVLADTSFSWDDENQILTFEGKPYKIGDELYLGGGTVSYPVGILADQLKINLKECGLNRWWLAG